MNAETESTAVIMEFDDPGTHFEPRPFYPRLVEDVRKKLATDPDPERVAQIEAALVRLPQVTGEDRVREYATVMRYLIHGA